MASLMLLSLLAMLPFLSTVASRSLFPGTRRRRRLCLSQLHQDLVLSPQSSGGARYGASVSIAQNGQIVAVGAPYHNGAAGEKTGLVQVFENPTTTWSQRAIDIEGETANDQAYATALSDDGGTLAVGSPASDNYNGKVRVFQIQNNRNWKQLGQSIVGIGGWFGDVVALSGDGRVLAVGAPSMRAPPPDARDSVGFVDVFELTEDDGAWVQKGSRLRGWQQGEGVDHDFGESVSLSRDGGILAVGAPDVYSFTNQGTVRVYEYSNNVWNQIGQDMEGLNSGDLFGRSVSLSSDGRIVAVGGHNGSPIQSGQVRVFWYSLATGWWSQLGQSLNGEAMFDNYGISVSLSGDGSILVVGGTPEDSTGGVVRVFQLKKLGTIWSQIGSDQHGSSGSNLGHPVAISRDGSTVVAGNFLSNTAKVYAVNETCQLDASELFDFLESFLDSTAAPTASLMDTAAPTASSMHTVASTASSMDTTAPTASSMHTVAPTDSSMDTTAPTDSLMDTPAPTDSLMDTPAPTDSLMDTPAPTDSLMDTPAPTSTLSAAPSLAPSPAPTASFPNFTDPPTQPGPVPTQGEAVSAMFSGITLAFEDVVGELRGSEIGQFELITENWFVTFFAERSGRSPDIRGMNTAISVVDQEPDFSGNGTVLINTITYDQTIEYTAFEGAFSAEEYIRLPFYDREANLEYAATLESELVAFEGVNVPLPIPKVPDQLGTTGPREPSPSGQVPKSPSSSPSSSNGALIGGIVGGIGVVVLIAGYLGYTIYRRKQRHSHRAEADDQMRGRETTGGAAAAAAAATAAAVPPPSPRRMPEAVGRNVRDVRRVDERNLRFKDQVLTTIQGAQPEAEENIIGGEAPPPPAPAAAAAAARSSTPPPTPPDVAGRNVRGASRANGRNLRFKHQADTVIPPAPIVEAVPMSVVADEIPSDGDSAEHRQHQRRRRLDP